MPFKKLKIFVISVKIIFTNLTIDNQNILIKEIDTLDYIDKLYLLSYITKDLIKSGTKTNYNLTKLKGLGKEV